MANRMTRGTGLFGRVKADQGLIGSILSNGAAFTLTGKTASSGAGGTVAIVGGTGAAGSAGGAVSFTGGVPTSGNAAGGAATHVGGAGSGTGAGGAASVTGGASGTGATGNGGAASLVGGAALSTNGTGGAAAVTGGVATGTGTGGAVTLTGGASAGASGTGGSVNLASGAAAGGTEGAVNVQTVSTGKLGFFGATAVVRQSAYTQTYSTADKTHAAPTAATLTMADGAGTNDNTIGAVTADASVIAALQEIVDEVNKLIADVADVKQLANSIIDDLQAYGLAQ